jgi:surface polysaccharide O-acyltransferase-like enzyme
MRASTLTTTSAEITTATGGIYLANWDRLRIVAAFDTLALHVTGTHGLLGFGLPLFLMLSVALSVSKSEAPDTGRFAARRFDRIVLPWLFWALVIAGIDAVLSTTAGSSPFGWFEWPMLLYGSRIHLWFLPFIVLAGLAAHFAHRVTERAHPWIAGAIAIAIAAALFPFPPHARLIWPFDQWFFSLPSVALGFALGRAVSAERDLDRLRLTLVFGFCLFAVLGSFATAADGDAATFVLRYAGGLGLLVFGSWFPNKTDPVTRALAPLMLGVFMLHPVVYELAVKPLLLAVDLGDAMVLRIALTFGVCVGLVALVRVSPLRRFV